MEAVLVTLADKEVCIVELPRFFAEAGIDIQTIPFVGRILIESLLRMGDRDSAVSLAQSLADAKSTRLEMTFRPARLIVQDYTGVPLLVDLAAIRDHLRDNGEDPAKINPVVPTEVVVDHSIQVDAAGARNARLINEALEFKRNEERYTFLKWAAQAFSNLRVVPPGEGIVHQVNIERLATVVALRHQGDKAIAFPDTVLGTDSHTTMVNGLGVLGWGVGGLEAEAVMLGLALPIPIPQIVGVRLTGCMRSGTMATDLVLALTAHLRACDLKGAAVEFTGPGVSTLSVPDRCTIANMAPEYGAMTGFFPVDNETLRYLLQTGRDKDCVRFVEAFCRHQRLLRQGDASEPCFSRSINFDLSRVEASLAGPSQPDQRISLSELPDVFRKFRAALSPSNEPSSSDRGARLKDGDIVIAAITSCTNTSNPKAMLAAGLLARRAVERGLKVPSHVKTSLAPGSRAVTRYLEATGFLDDLETLGFHVVGYGCTTCNGGSGPLAPDIQSEIDQRGLVVSAVLSGNRNFEGRIHSSVRAAFLASPPMVVALALLGNVCLNLETSPLGVDGAGRPILLSDLWPTDAELTELECRFVTPEIFLGNEVVSDGWKSLPCGVGPIYQWTKDSTYIRRPPYLTAFGVGISKAHHARALVLLGDFVSTDHISPVGMVPSESSAGVYLQEQRVDPSLLNSYGSRRGNFEVMARGTFANPRLQNYLIQGSEGGFTLHLPSAKRVTIFDAAHRYASEGIPLLVLAGKNYGAGSSRDWAAKGPWLLGVRVVIARSFERIHRFNLCAMGIVPLLFPEDESWPSLGIDGHEEFTLEEFQDISRTGRCLVIALKANGMKIEFTARADVASRSEWKMILRGGMLPYLLESLEAA